MTDTKEVEGYTGTLFVGYRIVKDDKTFRGIKTRGGNSKTLKKPIPLWNSREEYQHPMSRDFLLKQIKEAIQYGVSLEGCYIEKFSVQHGQKQRFITQDKKLVEELVNWSEYNMMKTNLNFPKLIEEASAELLIEKLKK